MKGTRAK